MSRTISGHCRCSGRRLGRRRRKSTILGEWTWEHIRQLQNHGIQSKIRSIYRHSREGHNPSIFNFISRVPHATGERTSVRMALTWFCCLASNCWQLICACPDVRKTMSSAHKWIRYSGINYHIRR